MEGIRLGRYPVECLNGLQRRWIRSLIALSNIGFAFRPAFRLTDRVKAPFLSIWYIHLSLSMASKSLSLPHLFPLRV